MRGEDAYVWATVYAAVCAAHGRDAAVSEADRALKLYRERVEQEQKRRDG